MRPLQTEVLRGAAQHYAAFFLNPNRRNRSDTRFIDGPGYVMQDLFNLGFKDEHDFLVREIKGRMGRTTAAEFDRLASNQFRPRDETLFHRLLADRLALDPDGGHILGKIGTVELDRHIVSLRPKRIMDRQYQRDVMRWARKQVALHGSFSWADAPPPVYETVVRPVSWPIYAGEAEERSAGTGVADQMPQHGVITMAFNMRISNEAAIAAVDAVVDRLDEGSTAATIRGRSGTQPAGPDATESGTLGFTLTCSDPAFGAGQDANPGGRATAGLVSDDVSADATMALSYVRAGATGTGADDHIDGEAGTSGSDFNFNTLSIVFGATVHLNSWIITQPESAS